jgi:hypothetical protein
MMKVIVCNAEKHECYSASGSTSLRSFASFLDCEGEALRFEDHESKMCAANAQHEAGLKHRAFHFEDF